MRCAMAWADWRTLDLVSSLRLTTRTTPLILCWIKWTRWISRSTTQTNRLKTSNKTNTYLAHFTETKDGNRPSCHFALHPGLCRTMSDFLFFFYGLEHITLADMQVKTFFIRIIFFLNDWEMQGTVSVQVLHHAPLHICLKVVHWICVGMDDYSLISFSLLPEMYKWLLVCSSFR